MARRVLFSVNGQVKVCQQDGIVLRHEAILRLDVPVNQLLRMHRSQRLQQRPHNIFGGLRR